METLRLTSSATLSTPPPITSLEQKHPEPDFELEDLFCILQIEPNDSLIAMELARRLRKAGRIAEAVRILRSVVDIDYRYETLALLAQAEYDGGDLDSAFEHLHQAVLVAPGEAPGLFEVFKTLGNIFVRRGDFDGAEDSYNKAYRLCPDSDALLVNFGTLAVQRRDWDGAAERFRQALELNRANDKAWVGLAIGHRMKGDFELAWGNLEAAFEYNPLNESALTLALDWGAADGREARVLEMLRGFLVAGGWQEKFSLAFAWLSFRFGERFVARLELERLLAVNPAHEQALRLAREMKACP